MIMNKAEPLKEIERLSNENEQLMAIAIDSNESIKAANDLAAKYHSMLNHLVELIKTQYDVKFKAEDIPGYLS